MEPHPVEKQIPTKSDSPSRGLWTMDGQFTDVSKWLGSGLGLHRILVVDIHNTPLQVSKFNTFA